MLRGYTEFQDFAMKNKISVFEKRLNPLIQNFNYYLIQNPDNCNKEIIGQLDKSQVIMIDSYQEETNQYFFICFERHFLIINQSNQNCIKNLFSNISNNKVFLFKESKDYFIKNLSFHISESNNDESLLNLEEEIFNFKRNLDLCDIYDQSIINFWNLIRHCISGFLIKKSYFNCTSQRIKTFFMNVDKTEEKEKEFNEDEFIVLRSIPTLNSLINICYHIEKQQIYCIKISKSSSEREIKNYKKLYHPFISQFYGTVNIDR